MSIRWLLACFSLVVSGTASAQPDQKPNIVIVLVDDAALMDFGVYGGESQTPNIDALAARGAMFTQYRTSPLCSPTRAMLLTGLDNHLTGVATIPEVLPEEHKGRPGYTMAFEPGVLTIADRLRPAGYRTLMVGKWHLGESKEEMPQAHGFDRSFSLAASGADNWEDKSYMPYYKDAPWWEDGEEAKLPQDFYSSKFIVDKMIDYLNGTDETKPFLAYLPFQAIHIPVQAPPEFIKKYEGVYDDGWDELRTKRHERAQSLGLVRKGSKLAPMPEGSRGWGDLSEADREIYAARMEVNAAMLDAMDFHLGRFIDHLKSSGQYDNTIFVVTSDNGPEPNRGDHDRRLAMWQWLNGYHVELEGIGEQGSWGFIGPEWATAAASPGALYKFYATEGGIRAPLIIAGPQIQAQTINSPAMVADITPTLLDWVGAPKPTGDARQITGRSLLPVLKGELESVYAPDDIRVIEVSGNTALYKGDYKITRSMPPVGSGAWQLYDISRDPGETDDLSEEQPQILAELAADYVNYAEQYGVLEMPAGYNSIEAVERNTAARVMQHYRGFLIGLGVGVLVLLLGVWRLGLFIWKRVRN